MTIKRILKSCAGAFLYFAIYFAWQIIVSNWASIAASAYMMSQTDPSEWTESYDTLYNRIYDILLQYTMEITLVSGILTLITVYMIFRFRHKQPFAEVGIRKLSLPHAFLCLTGGAALNVFTSIVMSVIPFPERWINSYMESSSILTDSGTVITLLVTVISAPLVEEVIFRGLIYSRLAKGLPMFAAMLISSWIFGVVHGNLLWFLYASLLGLVLCYIGIKTGSLLGSILLHAAFNGMSLILQVISGNPLVIDEVTGVSAVEEITTDGGILYVILLVSGMVSAVCLWRIAATSDKKIEIFTMPPDGNDDTHEN